MASEWELAERNWPEQRVNNVAGLWAVWRSQHTDLAPTTLEQYDGFKRRIAPWMEGKNVSPRTMADWFTYLRGIRTIHNEPLKGQSINRINFAMRGFLSWLKMMGYLQQDPGHAIPQCRQDPTKPIQTYTHAEYEQVKWHCQNKRWTQPFLWMIVLSYRTGLSLVDCAYLRWSEVVLREDAVSYIEIIREKLRYRGTKSRCIIPLVIGTDLWEMLMMLRETQHLNKPHTDGITDYVHPDCPVIYERKAVHIGKIFRCIFERALKLKEPVRFRKTFKHLRHTFCSNLLNSGADSLLVTKMTGHASVEMLRHYVKPDMTRLESDMARSYKWAEEQSGPLQIAPVFTPGQARMYLDPPSFQKLEVISKDLDPERIRMFGGVDGMA